MRNTVSILFLFFLIICYAVASEEISEAINADTLQGFTSSAFITTNDFETIKVTIEKLKSNAEACADCIVDLQLGLSTLSHDERLIREKDLNKIISDYSKISSELVSISSVENQGDRTDDIQALQASLEALEAELTLLQNYVHAYLGHLKSEEETWYFTEDGALLGTNLTMSVNSSSISSTVLIGQTFQVRNNSKIRKIKIKAELSAPPYNCVFLSPYSPTIATNTFVYANSAINEGNNIYSYSFNDYPVSTNSIYIFGVRGRNSFSHIYLNKCNDAYVGATNCLWLGTGSRYSLDALSEFDLTAQPNCDLCFDISFTSITNLIVSKDGIEIKNDASLKINDEDVATVPEINNRIAETSQSIYQSLSNHVFGTTSIANGSVTTEKLANNAVTASKIGTNAVTTSKINNGAVTENKIAAGAISGNKIQSNAISSSHISAQSITAEKLAANSVQLSHFTEPLKSNLVLSSGGVVTGKLEVAKLRITNNGHWHIGTVTNRADIIMDHSEACITSLSGDLNLAAGAGGNIKMRSFLELIEGQCGKVRILEGTSVGVISNNLSTNAIINVTPIQDPEARYWVDIDLTGQATINMSDVASDDIDFYFIIIKK